MGATKKGAFFAIEKFNEKSFKKTSVQLKERTCRNIGGLYFA